MPKVPEYKKRGYILPENLTPEKTCICIEIPCDKYHALAFLGQIEELGYWWAWERDEDKRGTQAAQIWRQIATDARDEIGRTGIFNMGCGCGSDSTRIVRQYIGSDGRWHVVYVDDTDEIRDDLDPRISNPTLPPLPGDDGDVKKCVAANSIVTAFQEMQQDEYEALLAGTNLAQALYNIIVAFVGLAIAAPPLLIPGIIALIITAVVNVIADMLPEDFDDQFTETTWQDLLCILYCEMDTAASFTEEQWQTVISRVETEIGGFAGLTWLSDLLNLIGPVGLTNAARTGYGGSRDCGLCDCETTCGDQFEVGNYGGNPAYGNFLGVYDGYHRFEGQNNGAGFYVLTIKTPDANTCCAIEDFNFVVGGGANAYFHINCGAAQTGANLAGDWLLNVQYNYISCQKTGAPFTVDIKFNT